MSESANIEELFQKFSIYVAFNDCVSEYDSTVIDSFSNVISLGNKLTEAQSRLMLRLLKKYRNIVKFLDTAAENLIDSPVWKQDFRVLDLSKKVFVEQTEDGTYNVVLKFPYSFRKEFEACSAAFLSKNSYPHWNSDRKLTVIPLYELNILVLHDFLLGRDFELDDTFLTAVALVEEIWENQENLLPMIKISQEKLEIFNVTDDAKIYWNRYSTGSMSKNLLLARSMGVKLHLERKPENIFEKIAIHDDNTAYWCKNIKDFFKIYKEIDDYSAIILDRNSNAFLWLSNFMLIAEQEGIPKKDIKICFRDADKDSLFNRWIKENEFGGTVDEGKLFIFNHKPAKWLFTKKIDVKLVGTNSLFPSSNITTQRWLESFPLMFYIGEIKASTLKESKIVEL